MDDTQEMNYRGIAKAIADTGYQGFISHEYSPLRDPLQSLEETLTHFRCSLMCMAQFESGTFVPLLPYEEQKRHSRPFRRVAVPWSPTG